MKGTNTKILRVVGLVLLTLTLLCPSANGQNGELTILTKAGQLASQSEWYKFLRRRPLPPPTRPHEVTSSVLGGLNGQIISRQFGLLGAKGITVLERSKDVVRPQLSTFSPDVSQLVPFTSAITEEQNKTVSAILRKLTDLKLRSIQDGMSVEERNAEFYRLYKSEFDDYLRFVEESTTPNEIKKKVNLFIAEKNKQIFELEKTSRTSQPVKAKQDNEHTIQSSTRGADVEGNLLQTEKKNSSQIKEEVTNSDVEKEDFESDTWWNSIYDLIKTTMPNLKVYLEPETNTYSLIIYDYGYQHQYEDAA